MISYISDYLLSHFEGLNIWYEPLRGAPGHVTNPGHLKMHQPRASRLCMLRCTALWVRMTLTAFDTLRHTWPNYQKTYIKDTRFVYKGMF